MKLTTLALVGASLAAFATPALAGGDGWYLGLGVGWSDQMNLTYQVSQPGGHIGA